MIAKIQEIIISCLKELNEVMKKPALDHPDKDTYIYGPKGTLDSLDLVALISDLEEKISDEYGINIVIADEKALSQTRSPFKSISNLSQYLELLIEEKMNA